ncbi:hypothetical protein Pan44_34790 [Caulifigura coniformis]|uniref:Ferritin/DPS protein domain-containing protein n=1 Tax=Caulifigura coniformis TaxID=2527983 RepID=A0A517SH33_9PLAN|nr:hypothetical protein [Caulifigura coniformis]QDT55436.1 hypothetical protein Pan44_34790 [Caulifigura coniformis]
MMLTAAEPILNDVLIALHRSLLQYMVDAWPWSGDEAASTREALASEAESQAETVEGLTELLRERGFPVAFGTYPDFSNLNYVSLDFLLKRVVKNQELVVAACEAAAGSLADHPEDAELVREIAESEQDRLRHLKSLGTAP